MFHIANRKNGTRITNYESPMKIGLISDIHGNQQALTKVLSELYSARVDLILCAGDLVCYGAQCNQVLELLRSCAIPSVVGNYPPPLAAGR